MSIRDALQQAYALLPAKMHSDAATLLLLAIQRQEDPQQLRYQKVARVPRTHPENFIAGTEQWAKGPARGLWQFEQGGAVKGVLSHQKTGVIASNICLAFAIHANTGSVWRNLESNDNLAACFARLLLWTDPQPLPEIGAEQQAFDCYLRTWRPGAWTNGDAAQRTALRQKWATNYAAALVDLQKPA